MRMAKMTKIKFLLLLNEKLSGLPQNEIEDRLAFYGEMIEDRIEEGMSEEEAVAAVGSIDEIADRIISDSPVIKVVKQRIKPKRKIKGTQILLLALGSPIWLSLLIAAVAVIVSLYLSIWAVIIALWSVFGSLIGCALSGFVSCVFMENSVASFALNGASIVCLGLSIFAFTGCKALTKLILNLTQKSFLTIKKRLIKKETAE